MASQRMAILFELILLFAAVLVFRSAWMLLDEIEIMSNNSVLIILLVVGTIVTAAGFYHYNKR